MIGAFALSKKMSVQNCWQCLETYVRTTQAHIWSDDRGSFFLQRGREHILVLRKARLISSAVCPPILRSTAHSLQLSLRDPRTEAADGLFSILARQWLTEPDNCSSSLLQSFRQGTEEALEIVVQSPKVPAPITELPKKVLHGKQLWHPTHTRGSCHCHEELKLPTKPLLRLPMW
jgi:hypothetical protein